MSRAHVQFKYHAKQRVTQALMQKERKEEEEKRDAVCLLSRPFPSFLSPFPLLLRACHLISPKLVCIPLPPAHIAQQSSPPDCHQYIPPNGSPVSRGGCPKRGKNGASMHAAAAEKGRRDILIRKKEGRGEMRGGKKTRLARSSPTTFSFFPLPRPT